MRGVRASGKTINRMDGLLRLLNVRGVSVKQGRVIVHVRNEWRAVLHVIGACERMEDK